MIAIALTLTACSTEQPPKNRDSGAEAKVTEITPETTNTPDPAAPSTSPSADNLLILKVLGTSASASRSRRAALWAERGAQASDTCRVVSSPDFPGVYAIVEDGKVRRITAGQRSTVKLAENIGVGSTERQVLDWFAGFRAEPHEYEAARAKYLTAPNAASGDPVLRFESGHDGKVSLIHVGTMPVLGYVEGCA